MYNVLNVNTLKSYHITSNHNVFVHLGQEYFIQIWPVFIFIL
jgi:hypothetical protein